jgi:N-methylhydantoinase A
MRVGVEIGGTFTDLVSLSASGEVRFVKVPSVKRRPDEGAMAAIVAANVPLEQVAELVHGSTVATNAVIERSGARVAFITTNGFRDILHLQRQDRRRIYDLAYRKPTPIVPRHACFEVRERVLADGSVADALDEAAIERELIPKLVEGNFGAIAICLLNAYRNPTHEQALAHLIARRLQGIVISCSSDVAPEFREYERASTTAIAAYVQPIIDAYLGRLEGHLADGRFSGSFSVMQSNGGRLPSEGMRKHPVAALFSGPAAGVMGAIQQASLSGFRDLITFDMGGTSTDVCLVSDGEPELAASTEIDGLPVRTPLLDIVSIGAGCGSVAWVDDGGMLRVGPQSAGADPGPACYGHGGERPTITDAHVIRGTIRPEAFLGGGMPIDSAAAGRAFAPLAQQFGMSLPGIADAAIGLANGSIVRAIQLVSTERGRDPRDYVLVAFGGAGPLHAAEVASELGIGTILVPPYAGVISAYGLLAADYRLYETATRRTAVDEAAPAAIKAKFGEMRQRLLSRLAALGIPHAAAVLILTLEMRFVGQAFEVPVHLAANEIDALSLDRLQKSFAAAHHRVYRHGSLAQQRMEIISFRLGARVAAEAVPALRLPPTRAEDRPSPHRLFAAKQEIEGVAAPRAWLRPGGAVSGPAVLDDPTSTIYVPKGWRAVADEHENLLLRRSDA